MNAPDRLNTGPAEEAVRAPTPNPSRISPEIRSALAAHSPEIRAGVLRVADAKP
jgi:hypothetical protein